MKLTLLSSVLLALLAAAAPARASDLTLAAGFEGASTSWDEDGAAYVTFGAGYLWRDLISADLILKSGVGAVEERSLQTFALGARIFGRLGGTRPFARAALVHQHEISRDAVRADPIANLGGWGDGIRHRAGAALGAGLLYPFTQTRWGSWFAEIEIGGTGFTEDEKGPRTYWGLGASIGLAYDLGRRRDGR